MLIKDKYPQWLMAGLEPEIGDLAQHDGCGEDCCRVLDATLAFISVLDEVRRGHLRNIIAAASYQCNVYYFG